MGGSESGNCSRVRVRLLEAIEFGVNIIEVRTVVEKSIM